MFMILDQAYCIDFSFNIFGSRNRLNTTMPHDKTTEGAFSSFNTLSLPQISPGDCPGISDGLFLFG